ncbi:Hypothetical predicted protein [Paramuricea clavata]|uniref:Uncharacterized protein n=1 Tax=Paramuricea clavata TaxID=317549 RepID=A0A6S7I6E1_PARCT|nr:Hypothetical predicted protein [Paramuricea clavata]
MQSTAKTASYCNLISYSIQSGEKVQISKENAENQKYVRDAFCGKEGEDGHAQFHPQKSDITDAQTSYTSQEPKSPISVSSIGTLDLDPNEKINNFSQSEVVPCDCFGDLVEDELRTTSLNQEDFNSENSNSDTEDSVTETIKDSVSESQKSNWIESVASLSCISSLMYGCQEMVNDARTSDIPNVEQWIVGAQDTIKQVQESCVRFLKNTDSLLHQIQMKKPKVNRRKLFSAKVVLFPSQSRYTSGETGSPLWYNKYPDLEYSIKKDAVFCFVCTLFHDAPSKEKADPSWISTGVRKWHKMKSVGKNKQGKLAQHFSLQSHKASLAAYCHFLKKTEHVDIQLDKAKRATQIQEAEDLECNHKVIHILLDIARTLARQALPFRGDSNEEGNFYQLVLVVSRHVPSLRRWITDKRMNPYHATYLSAQSQKEFITFLEAELREKFCRDDF